MHDMKKQKSHPKAKSTFSSVTKLAELLGVDRKSLQRWSKESGFPDRTRDGYEIELVRSWVELNQKKGAARKELLDEERREKIETLKVKRHVMMGAYTAKDEVTQEVARMVETFKRALKSRATQLAPRLIGMTVAAAKVEIEKSDADCLAKIANDPWIADTQKRVDELKKSGATQ
jgi:hypothetical protein